MRTMFFKSFEQVIRSDPRTLAQEYHSLATNAEHEFGSDEARDAYAAVVHAVGMFQYRLSFPDKLEHLMGEHFVPLRTSLLCRSCGSDDITADATAAWDTQAGGYSLVGTYDDHTCQGCGREGSDIADHHFVAPEPRARVRIKLRAPTDGDALDGRTGTVARVNHVQGGLYIKLDQRTDERIEPVALVALADLEQAAPAVTCGPISLQPSQCSTADRSPQAVA